MGRLAAACAAALCAWLLVPAAPRQTAAVKDQSDGAPIAIEIASIELTSAPAPAPEAAPAHVPEPALPPSRVEPVLPPRPEPAPAPPQPADELVVEAISPTADALARGSSLLRAGAFPRLRATYARIGFAAYRDAMLALGGAFYLFDPTTREPVALVDPLTGTLGPERVRADLSRWPRDVTRHVGLALARGTERYGARVSRVILLPPERLDAALLGALDTYLRRQGLDAEELLRVDVAYELVDGRLHCEVLSLALRDGSERRLGLRIDLTGGVPA